MCRHGGGLSKLKTCWLLQPGSGTTYKNSINLSAKVGYQRAIYLAYGDEDDDRLVNNIIRCARKITDLASIELWVHHQVGEPAIHRVTLPAEGRQG
jgi:hypothetical protein